MTIVFQQEYIIFGIQPERLTNLNCDAVPIVRKSKEVWYAAVQCSVIAVHWAHIVVTFFECRVAALRRTSDAHAVMPFKTYDALDRSRRAPLFYSVY